MPKKFWVLVVAILTINLIPTPASRAIDCPDLKIIFARGSGQERWVDQDYVNFKNELAEKLELTNLNYEFEDLDYPAIGIGNPFIILNTFVSGGEAYEFGASVDVGIKNLLDGVNGSECRDTKYVLGGYSQGAMVVSKAINYINPDKVVFATTFGDPKIYLPEGGGFIPAACKGANLSNYRIYVPDCRVYEGLLGGNKPYQPDGYIDKLGTWCNKTDIFCSTHFSINSHVSYASDGLYKDASRLIFDKVCKAFGIKNSFVSLHDTAILIDSTSSMDRFMRAHREEILNLAKKTLEADGRVALYDYRDLGENYHPVEHCNFDTCTLEKFEEELDKISFAGGGDVPESLLSASFNVMKKLSWKFGSTKSLVIFTDANYHESDLDNVTFADVVNLSKKIDPVNFYIVTTEDNKDFYQGLAEATDGAVTTSFADTIMARFDSLPRVEEEYSREALPEITNVNVEKISDTSIQIDFSSTGGRAIIAFNDLVLGVADSGILTIFGVDFGVENILTLTPISENLRGKSVQTKLQIEGLGKLEIPMVPNAGKL
ncbi:cutinase family protein [Candidatus Saccharibacteria bacterium]|nr:cutinase family protein [Candidatus Saccharibacteria bacterium]